MSTEDIIRLILIILVILFFVISMITKKISTIIALPAMGILVALVSTVSIVDGSLLIGWFDHADPSGAIDEATGEVIKRSGIMNGVIGDGTKMLISSIVSAIFGGALAVILKKLGVVEEIVRKIAELGGDRPLAIALLFYIMTTLIFAAIGGLGPVILIGSIALPIMLSVGIKARDAGAIVLLGLSTGGILNPSNWALYTDILGSAGLEHDDAYNQVANMSYSIFAVIFIISVLYIILIVKNGSFRKTWAKKVENVKSKKVSGALLLTPIVPIILIFFTKILVSLFPDSNIQLLTPEVAILLGIIYAVFVSRAKNKAQLVTSSFIEGTQQVAGAIILLMGLGILLKGFQYYTVTPIITPSIEVLVGYLQNPITYVLGFTIATPLVLYRGPLNTFGIGGSIPAIFASAGFNPIATVYALRAVGNLQGFGDPTNSQNIWVADFLKIDPNEITKRLFFVGFVMSFAVLLMAVLLNPDLLT